jgi:hypothetical protein
MTEITDKIDMTDNILFQIYTGDTGNSNFKYLLTSKKINNNDGRYKNIKQENILIKGNILDIAGYTFIINRFCRNTNREIYKIFTDKYHFSKPIFEVFIYDDEIEVLYNPFHPNLHDTYQEILKGIQKDIFLKKINNAYEQFQQLEN